MEQLYPLIFSHGTFLTHQSQQSKDYGRFRTFSQQAPQFSGSVGCLAALGALIIFIGGMVTMSNSSDSLPRFFLFFIGAPLGGFLVYYAAMRYWFMAVGPRLGAPQMMVSAAWLRLGDDLDITYQQEILKDSTLLAGSIELFIRESVRYTCGTDTCYAKHDHSITSEAFKGQSLVGGMTLSQRFRLQIPLDSMPTFGAPNNKIGWIVRVNLSFENLSKYEELYEITVTA